MNTLYILRSLYTSKSVWNMVFNELMLLSHFNFFPPLLLPLGRNKYDSNTVYTWNVWRRWLPGRRGPREVRRLWATRRWGGLPRWGWGPRNGVSLGGSSTPGILQTPLTSGYWHLYVKNALSYKVGCKECLLSLDLYV